MEWIKVIRNEQFYAAARGILIDARKRIDVCTYKFEFSTRPAARDLNRLIDILYAQAYAGIKVRVLLNTNRSRSGLTKINEHAARILKTREIEVRTLPDSRCQHAKMILVDNCLGLIGSHNWSPKSLTENFEVSVDIRHAGYLQDICEHFEKIWTGAKEIK